MLFEPPPERPQTVGDLIGRAFRVYRRQVPIFFTTLLGPTIVSALGALSLQWALSQGLSAASDHPQAILVCVAAVGIGLITLLLSKWVLTLRQLAFVRVADGFAPDYPTAHAFLNQRKWSLFVLFFLGIFFIFALCLVWSVAVVIMLWASPKNGPLGSLAAALAAVVGISTLVLSVSVVFLVGFMTFCVLSCEEGDLNTFISRGFSLVVGDFSRACSFALLLVTVMWMISCPLSLPVVALASGDLIQKGLTSEHLSESYTMPLYIMIFSQAWESLVNMLLWPVIYLTFGFFYYDVRLRQEGLDILRNLDELERNAA